MAITNQERVGKAMELLRAGLAPFVEREFKSQHQAQATEAARRYFGDDRAADRKPVGEWDVASGRYQQVEFATDLWQVHLGEGPDEYRKPLEFFRRTYLTESLKRLLVGGVQRLAGQGGDPVVQLQTNWAPIIEKDVDGPGSLPLSHGFETE